MCVSLPVDYNDLTMNALDKTRSGATSGARLMDKGKRAGS